jgi:long-chain acyl-CoA synthetase
MEPFLIERIKGFGDELAVGELGKAYSYADILGRFQVWRDRVREAGIDPGMAVSLEGEYGAEAISAFLALLENDNIIVPLTDAAAAQHDTFREIAGVEKRIVLEQPDNPVISMDIKQAENDLYGTLRARNAAGLVLFTSGSTGASKAAVHDLDVLLDKYQKQRHKLKTIVFLQLDHIGGVNTLFYTLSNGGAVIVPSSRAAADVCSAIEAYRAQLLPSSPTFLNLLLLSGEHEKHDLSSLDLITYGTEPMPQSTLKRTNVAFPSARLQQTYGSTELGILGSRSRNNSSLWVRVGGSGYETKIVDGTLRVRSRTAMLGYLNAPSPFDADGFMDTGDKVEVDGEWIHILGRDSEVINVGGSKVHPSEVESVLLEIDEIEDASVRGQPHPILGQIVAARVQLRQSMSPRELKQLVRHRCQNALPSYALPVKIEISREPLYSARFKRRR